VAAALVSAIGVAVAADSSATSPAAIFVANLRGYVTVYPLGSNSDVAPISTIDGAATRLGSPEAIALDSKGNIYVTSEVWNAGAYAGGSVVVFSASSKGNASPIATIAGPHTGLHGVNSVTVDSSGNIYVGAQIGNDGPAGVEVFAAGSNGDVKPQVTIVGPDTGVQNANGIAIDPRGALFVANVSGVSRNTGVLVFPAASNGNATPSVTISGDKTGVDWPVGVVLDPRGNIYMANAGRNGVAASIRLYSVGSNGNVPPIATISGSNTGLNGRTVRGIALDSKENLYVTSDGHDSTESSITVFKAGSNGNVKPIAVISGDNTGLSAAVGIAIGPYQSTR
jgi:sugar lactone lactonase YvrE